MFSAILTSKVQITCVCFTNKALCLMSSSSQYHSVTTISGHETT